MRPAPGSPAGSSTRRVPPAVAAGLATLALLTACTAAPGTESPGSSTAGSGPASPPTRPAASGAPQTTLAQAPTTASPPVSGPTTTPPVSGPTGGPAGFSATVATVDEATAARMATSWRAGCPVPLTDLRYLTLTYRGFDGADHTGELVVAASVADDVVAIFRQLYQDGYPIASMRLVDDFGGADDASMAANNTSAFNCRPVTGGGGFSEHSYGTAIDVNPVQNPSVSGSTVLPPAGRPYLGRPDAPGVIHDGDPVVAAFAAHGFQWGGHWRDPTDYQHFSVSGR